MILNRQRSVAVSLASLDRFWQRARRSLRLPPDSLTICLVSETQMARWNRAYRGKRRSTDVLSFPANGERASASGGEKRKRAVHPANAEDYLGDIAIAPAVARRNARRLGRALEEELHILILHGALHLLGYDHETDHGEMDRIEQRLRRHLRLAP